MSEIDSRFRRRSRATLEARLYHALGHGGTEAFFGQLLKRYGDEGAELARRIAADDPAGLRPCAIGKVERHPQVAPLCSPQQAEAYTAAQVYNLGAGIVFAQHWAKLRPQSLERYRASHGWSQGALA
ncbi:hypothetical protein [Methylobacterium radiotolerans]|uniref:hypothetical protein n=1 Tax=Methylobacterium radiotolerans TaxID=31998 RepID=UPI001F1BDF56|nr:hypothetical protein [Methylobacterium radiotolerans]UIY44106.1 hypothetical protein LZ599_10645 [Methylobacterium radiotolerans]